MRDPHNVLIRPVVSEKSYSLMDNNVYVFVVDPTATKIDVRHAVEQAFSVRVTSVNTLNRKGKTKRNRKGGGVGHQDRRAPRRGAGLQRPRGQGQHPQPQGQDQAQPQEQLPRPPP